MSGPPVLLAEPRLAWINRLARLDRAVDEASAESAFGTEVAAEEFPSPHWIATSADCAAALGFPADWATRPDWQSLAVFTGQALWPSMRPLATVYSGHQFGVWAGQLGDGRASMLGELQVDTDSADFPGGTCEIQLKGAGRTPYSRHGDGRAVLRSSIREFLCSEAMHALGVPTTRALCVAGSELPVRRESVETAAIVTRVAPSFLRFGHCEHFAHYGLPGRLRELVDFTIANWFPECRVDGEITPAARLAWFGEVVRRTARLMAQWQSLGFCHGVMNTDNMSLLGLTIDYGPFGFLDAYDPGHVCNHSDSAGRYAFGRQPQAAGWNLQALAFALSPLFDDAATALPPLLAAYPIEYADAFMARLRAKLGLTEREAADGALVQDFLDLLAQSGVDHTIAFRRLAEFDRGAGAVPAPVRELFPDAAIDAWGARYLARLEREPRDEAGRREAMRACNPHYILRNHLAQHAIEQAERGDFGEVARLHDVLRRPFDDQPGYAAYADFPPAWAREIEVSCSS